VPLFGIVPRSRHVSNEDQDVALGWLRSALTWSGAGAKTAVGYWRFRDDDDQSEAFMKAVLSTGLVEYWKKGRTKDPRIGVEKKKPQRAGPPSRRGGDGAGVASEAVGAVCQRGATPKRLRNWLRAPSQTPLQPCSRNRMSALLTAAGVNSSAPASIDMFG